MGSNIILALLWEIAVLLSTGVAEVSHASQCIIMFLIIDICIYYNHILLSLAHPRLQDCTPKMISPKSSIQTVYLYPYAQNHSPKVLRPKPYTHNHTPSVRCGVGRVFTRQTPPLHGSGGGMFRVIPAPPPSGVRPHLFPGRGPVFYHLFLTGTRLGYAWGVGLSGDRGREC